MIIYRPKEERQPRSGAIRLDFNRRYPDLGTLRQELFDKQSTLCLVCKQPIQSADSVVAEIDHAIPVYCYATWDYPPEEACRHANAKKNLVLLHTTCNKKKNATDIDEYLERVEAGEINLGAPKMLTPERLAKMKVEQSERARKAGRIANESLGPEGRTARSHKAGLVGGRKSSLAALARLGREGVAARMAVLSLAAMEKLGPEGMSIRGRKGGRQNVVSGHLDRIRNLPQTKEAQRANGRKTFELYGNPATLESCAKGGRIVGRKNAESGHLARISSRANCVRWNIRRGKPCVCGSHKMECKRRNDERRTK